MVNGLCIDVEPKDFESYKTRENQYFLYKTSFDYICPKTGKLTHTKQKAYIL
jgi:hypothetical protein